MPTPDFTPEAIRERRIKPGQVISLDPADIANRFSISELDAAHLLDANEALATALEQLYEFLALGPIEAAAKFGPDFDLKQYGVECAAKAEAALAQHRGE